VSLERKWERVSQAFTANGATNGAISVADASGFYVKQKVTLTSNTQQPKYLEVRRVNPLTIFTAEVGTPFGSPYYDVSAFLLADNANITAEEQVKPTIKLDDIIQAVFAREPSNAIRSLLVDALGTPYGDTHPVPVNLTSPVVVDVDTDGFDATNPDSELIVGSENGTKTGTKHAARVDSALDLRVGISNGSNKAGVNSTGQLSVTDSDTHTGLASIVTALGLTLDVSDSSTHTALASILSALGSVLDVSDATTHSSLASILSAISSLVNSGTLSTGTENGTPTGVRHVFVNNLRKMILDSHDRSQAFSYSTVGIGKRLDTIAYTSATFPGVTALKTITWADFGTKTERVVNISWSIT